MLFFSDRGKVYSEKVYQIPDADRAARGIPLVNVLSLAADERVTAAIAVSDFTQHGFCLLATGRGKVKRVNMQEFADVQALGPDRHEPGRRRYAWLGASHIRQG